MVYQEHELTLHFAEAHNDYLQLAAEGGLLLTIPAALCVASFVIAVRRRFSDEQSIGAYWLRVGAVTGLVAIGLQETVDFSLQMPGNAALFAASIVGQKEPAVMQRLRSWREEQAKALIAQQVVE